MSRLNKLDVSGYQTVEDLFTAWLNDKELGRAIELVGDDKYRLRYLQRQLGQLYKLHQMLSHDQRFNDRTIEQNLKESEMSADEYEKWLLN